MTTSFASSGVKNLFSWRFVSCAILLIVSVVFTATTLSASRASAAQTIPYRINFQGRLTDASGNIKADGLYNMRLRVYTAATGGTLVGSETRDGAFRVQVTNGLFSMQVGENSGLDPSLFTQYPLYLEIELPTPATATCTTVGCGTWTEGPMSPRSAFGSSPYAFNADTVDGIDGSSLARNNAPNTFTAANLFAGAAQFNTTMSLNTGSSYMFNSYFDNGVSRYLSDGSSAYFFNDADGLQLGASAVGTAGSTLNNSSEILKLKSVSGSVKAAIDSGVTYGRNQLSNPSFEFDCAGWLSCEYSSAQPRTGAKSSSFVQSTPASSRYGLSRYFSTTPGDTVYVHGYVKTTAATTGTGGFYLAFFDANGATLSTAGTPFTNPGTSYSLKNVSATAPAGTVYAAVGYAANGDGTTAGSWYWDDIYAENITQQAPAQFKAAASSTTAFSIQDTSGSALFVADTTNKAILIGGGDTAASATPTILVLSSKNTVNDPAGRTGGMYYNAFSGKFRCYEVSAWKNCIGAAPLGTTANTYLYQNDYMYPNATPSSGYFPSTAPVAGQFYTVDSSTGITTSTAATGMNSQITGEANHSGITRLSTGTGSATTTTAIASSLSSALFGNGTTWTKTTQLRVPTASTGTQKFTVRDGFMDGAASAEPANGCYIRYTNGTNSSAWQGVCRKAGAESVCDPVNGSSASAGAITANNWYLLKMAVSADASSATFVVNGSFSCTIGSGSNIPTAPVGFGSAIAKSVGTGTAGTLDLDYVEVSGENINR